VAGLRPVSPDETFAFAVPDPAFVLAVLEP
jgi:hypothetical protein